MRPKRSVCTIDCQGKGYYVWLAEAELLPGDSLIAKIQDAIREVDYVAVLLSKASVASSWVAKEVQVALNREISGRRVIVVPIVIEPCDIPPFLADKVYADLSEDFDGSLSRLIERFRAEVPGSQTRRNQAQRLLSLGFDRWLLADRIADNLSLPSDVRDVVRHLDMEPMAPALVDYLVESPHSSPGGSCVHAAPLAGRFKEMSSKQLDGRFGPLLADADERVRSRNGAFSWTNRSCE